MKLGVLVRQRSKRPMRVTGLQVNEDKIGWVVWGQIVETPKNQAEELNALIRNRGRNY